VVLGVRVAVGVIVAVGARARSIARRIDCDAGGDVD